PAAGLVSGERKIVQHARLANEVVELLIDRERRARHLVAATRRVGEERDVDEIERVREPAAIANLPGISRGAAGPLEALAVPPLAVAHTAVVDRNLDQIRGL